MFPICISIVILLECSTVSKSGNESPGTEWATLADYFKYNNEPENYYSVKGKSWASCVISKVFAKTKLNRISLGMAMTTAMEINL